MMIAVAGCVAQAEGAEIVAPRARRRHRGRAAGLSPPARAAGARARARAGAARSTPTSRPRASSTTCPAARARRASSAFLTVQEGCDKFCTFCVVPYTRGAESIRARRAASCAEARALVDAGAREITLLGQNVNAYHGEAPDGATWSLAGLIRALAEIDGLDAASATRPRIRATWTTS